jgi:hypothetical protein
MPARNKQRGVNAVSSPLLAGTLTLCGVSVILSVSRANHAAACNRETGLLRLAPRSLWSIDPSRDDTIQPMLLTAYLPLRVCAKTATVAAATAMLALCSVAVAGEGIWKAAIPGVGSMKGEFDNNDPIGLFAGVAIKADCSLNWTDPDDHKLYCFSSATSLVFFLDSPAHYLESARESWQKLNSSSG